MVKITLDDQSLRYITLFENITQTRVKDCLELYNTLYFIVDTGQLQFALGRNGLKVKRLRAMLKKNIKIIEYSPNTERFIRNIFHEFPVKEITIEEDGEDKNKNKVAYVSVDIRDKGKVIGRDSRNLKVAREIINRHEKIDILII